MCKYIYTLYTHSYMYMHIHIYLRIVISSFRSSLPYMLGMCQLKKKDSPETPGNAPAFRRRVVVVSFPRPSPLRRRWAPSAGT